MSRYNDVKLFGFVGQKPEIYRNSNTGTYTRAMFNLVVAQGSRFDGTMAHGSSGIAQDFPLVLSLDPEIIRTIASLNANDAVEIHGVYVQKKIPKITVCPYCGEQNRVEGNIYFVMPQQIYKWNTEPLTIRQAEQIMRDHRETSNTITVLGNVCTDVKYYNNPSAKLGEGNHIQTSEYQIAVDRRLRVMSDSAEQNTDFISIKSFGANAERDYLSIIKGETVVLVDGFIHTRTFERETNCAACGKAYKWNTNTTEIVPYATEYIGSRYKDPEERKEELRQERLAEAEKIKSKLFAG